MGQKKNYEYVKKILKQQKEIDFAWVKFIE